MKKTQLKIDEEYFEKMESSIIRDCKGGRNKWALLGSICRSGIWWENKIDEVQELYPSKYKLCHSN